MHALRPPRTPAKGNTDLLAFYTDGLCRLIDFELPYTLQVSPSQVDQSGEVRIVNQVNFLFYQARPALDEVLRLLAALEPSERTRTCLLEILSREVREFKQLNSKSASTRPAAALRSRRSESYPERQNKAELQGTRAMEYDSG
nr:hypothetical protein CFP56_67372 [Quercus suber]